MMIRTGVQLGLAAAVVAALVPGLPAQAAPNPAPLPTVTAMSPRSGSIKGDQPLTLRGSGLADATKVLFGGVASKMIRTKSAGSLRVRTPKHAAGTVEIQVVTPAGTSAVQATTDYRFTTAPTALTWSKPTSIDPYSGSTPTKSVSCVSATFCMAVNDNHVARYEGHAWQRPFQLEGQDLDLLSVSCASTKLCVAIGTSNYRGVAYVYDGKSWTTTAAAKSRGTLHGVSCAPGTTYCLAAGSAGLAYDGGSWRTVTVPRHALPDTVSCVSRSFCMTADGGDNYVYDDRNGISSKPVPVRLGGQSWAVSCVSSSDCVEVGQAGKFSRYNGTAWSRPKSIAKDFRPIGVSCVKATYCLAVDSSGSHRVARFTGKSWGTAPAVKDPNADLAAVSCWSGAHCVSIDEVGDAYLRTGHDWHGPTPTLPYTGTLTDVSCASTTRCIAVDFSGNALRYNGTRWSAPAHIANDKPLAAVSCPAVKFCVAVDGRPPAPLAGYSARTVFTTRARGQAYVYTGASWVATRLIDTRARMTDVSCASTTFCVAVDNGGNELTYSAGKWSKPELIDKRGELSTVDCPVAAFCVVGSLKGYVTYWNGTTWTSPHRVADRSYLTDVSCPDMTYCAIAGLDGVEVRNGTLLGHDLAGFDEEAGYSSVTCVSATFCLAGTQNADDDEGSQGGQSYSFDGSALARGRVTVYAPKLDCVTPSFCVGVESDGTTAGVGTS